MNFMNEPEKIHTLKANEWAQIAHNLKQKDDLIASQVREIDELRSKVWEINYYYYRDQFNSAMIKLLIAFIIIGGLSAEFYLYNRKLNIIENLGGQGIEVLAEYFK